MLATIAKKLRELAEKGKVEEADIEEVEQFLWNNGDLQEDSLVPALGPGYRGPHNLNQTVRRPLRVTVQNTKPPRGGVKR